MANESNIKSKNSNTYAPVKLWLEPSELRRVQAARVLERLAARKLDKRLEAEWGCK